LTTAWNGDVTAGDNVLRITPRQWRATTGGIRACDRHDRCVIALKITALIVLTVTTPLVTIMQIQGYASGIAARRVH
jgi:hypothetical protein